MTLPTPARLPDMAASRPTGAVGTTASALRRTQHLLLWVSIVLLTMGISLPSAVALSLATAAVGVALATSDISRLRHGGITPITVYALSAAAAALANVIGLSSADGPQRSKYFVYAVDEHLFIASVLWLLGTVIPVLGFWAVARGIGFRQMLAVLPLVSARVDLRSLKVWATLASLAALGLQIADVIPSLGTLTAMVALIPQLSIFVLARLGAERRDGGALAIALTLAVLEATRAFLYEYLRLHLVAPFVAFAFGMLLGRRSFAALRSWWFVPVYLIVTIFSLTFGLLGQMRVMSGESRLEQVAAAQEMADDAGMFGSVRRQSVVSRMTTFNQLSQVARLVERDGHYDGATLEYLGFAFIPRFLWPDKPLIAKGSWFAVRIGYGYVLPDGRVSNSINMTVPGELYLNFAWAGVLVGCLLYGALLAILWSRAAFWSTADDALGGAFGFYLIWIGFITGPDLQVIVTMIAIYLIFAAGSFVLRGVTRGRAATDPVSRLS